MTTNCLTLTKFQQREVNTALARLPILGADYAARALSALYRASMRAKARAEILAAAQSIGVTSNAEWII